MLLTKQIDTPVGLMTAVASDAGICVFDFSHRKLLGNILNRAQSYLSTEICEGEHPHFIALEKQLEEYFTGTRQVFDLPLQLLGSTFQISVWQALQRIPYAATSSYKKQSQMLGDEKAIRAVARANGENGLAILIPCHRVLGENGSLVGYSGGLHRKQWLLNHERQHAGKSLQPSLF